MRTLEDLNRQHETSVAARTFVKAVALLGANDPMYGKAVVSPASLSTAADLLRTSRAFVNVVQRATLLGRLTGTVPAPVGAGIPAIDATDIAATWVGDAGWLPLARFDLGLKFTAVTKLGIMIAVTRELLRATDDRALSLLEAFVVRALRLAEDRALLDVNSAITNLSPAGLLNGVSAISTGSPDDADFVALWDAVRDGDPMRPFFIVSPRGALFLAAQRGSGGAALYPDIGPLGGSLFGVPVLTSRAAGEHLILIDAAELVVSDNGLEVTLSTETSIQMDSGPSASPSNVVSPFQTNAAALKFVRYLHWQLMHDDAIAFLDLPIAGSPS